MTFHNIAIYSSHNYDVCGTHHVPKSSRPSPSFLCSGSKVKLKISLEGDGLGTRLVDGIMVRNRLKYTCKACKKRTETSKYISLYTQSCSATNDSVTATMHFVYVSEITQLCIGLWQWFYNPSVISSVHLKHTISSFLAIPIFLPLNSQNFYLLVLVGAYCVVKWEKVCRSLIQHTWWNCKTADIVNAYIHFFLASSRPTLASRS